MILTLDGEHFHLAAVEDYSKKHANSLIEFFKWAAGCSFFQQPNDQAASYMILRQRVKTNKGNPYSVSLKYRLVDNDSIPPYLAFLTDRFKGLEASSKRTFLKFFQYLPSYLSTSMQKRHLETGWQSPGVYPYDIHEMLKFWPGFASYEHGSPKPDQLVNAIKTILIPHASLHGFVDDRVMYEAINDFLPSGIDIDTDLWDRCRETLVLNRWRATWINNAGTIAKRKEVVDAATAAAQAKEAATREKATSKANSTKRKQAATAPSLPVVVASSSTSASKRIKPTEVVTSASGRSRKRPQSRQKVEVSPVLKKSKQ